MLILQLNMQIKIQFYILTPTSFNTRLSEDEYDWTMLVKSSGCEHRYSTLIEAMLVLSWSNVQVNSEEELCASRVEVHR